MKYLVADIGSSNGKIYLAELLQDQKLYLEEVDRFETLRSFQDGHIVTDIIRIYEHLCRILQLLKKKGIYVDSIGIDTWCSDFVLIDMDSGMIKNPVFYRDKWTDGYREKVEEKFDPEELYGLVTQRRVSETTLCQLLAYLEEHKNGLRGNKKILFLGDALMYLFTGRICSELSVASYSQMFNTQKNRWENEVFERFQIPEHIQPPVVNAGTVLGKIDKNLQQFLGINEVKVVAPAVHDTASAIVSVPAFPEEKWAVLATGSWYLMAMETEKIDNLREAYEGQFSNTGLAFGKKLTKKNITGMWLLQECRKQWGGYSYEKITKLAEEAKPFYAMVDTEFSGFYHPENMLNEILAYLRETGQKVPDENDVGQITRIIYESIILKVAEAFDMLQVVTDQKVDVVYVIGGGIRIEMMNQFLADALGITVRLGPVEASAVGNALLQAYGLGEIHSEEEIREIVRKNIPSQEYNPIDQLSWRKALEQFKKVCKTEQRGECI